MKEKSRIVICLIPLLVAFLLWFCRELNLLSLGSPFGGNRWTGLFIWLFSTAACLISIPFLVISAYSDFQNDVKIWRAKLFLLYPLFLFGFFFQSVSAFPFTFITIPLSLLVVFSIHLYLLVLSAMRAISKKQSWSYFGRLACLTIYYTVLITSYRFVFDLFHSF